MLDLLALLLALPVVILIDLAYSRYTAARLAAHRAEQRRRVADWDRMTQENAR